MKKSNVFTSFLSLLKIRYTDAYSNQHFNEHPYKNTLYGLSNMLSKYHIENAGTRITDKETDIFNIELPFIAHAGSDFVVVYKVDAGKVHYLWNGKKIVISISQFISTWSGIILLTETTPESIEPDYKEHRKKELVDIAQKAILALASTLILGIIYINYSLFSDPVVTSLLAVNLTGVYICYLLIIKQLHIQSQYADKICSLFSKNDCNNVLESEAARLWGIFGWSEVGLGYFVANCIILLLLPHLIPYLAIVNILTLPYSFWSIWYQKVKARQWCPLCLIVQVLLWAIFVLNGVFGYIQISDFYLQNILIAGCIYIISILTFNLIIPRLSKGREVESLRQEINSIKANEVAFRTLLNRQPYHEVSKSDSQILFGNPNAQLTITILTNPFCNPCAQMHLRVEELLKETKGEVCIQYIFSSFNESLEYANKYLIAAYLKEKVIALQVFNEWFSQGKTRKERFFENLQLDICDPVIEAEFQKHESWKQKMQLHATPTILINGYQLADNYKIEDLKYFTEFNVDIK